MTGRTLQLLITGCSFKNRQTKLAWIERHPRTRVWLEREPECIYDPNAVRVMAECPKSDCIGYLSRDAASYFAPLLDKGMRIAVTRIEVVGSGKQQPKGCRIDITWPARR